MNKFGADEIKDFDPSEWHDRDFDPSEWDIQREGRQWTGEEFEKRIYQAPEKIEFVGGIFVNKKQRLTV